MNWTKEQPTQPGVYGAIDGDGETAFIFLSHIDGKPYVLAVYGVGIRHAGMPTVICQNLYCFVGLSG